MKPFNAVLCQMATKPERDSADMVGRNSTISYSAIFSL